MPDELLVGQDAATGEIGDVGHVQQIDSCTRAFKEVLA
jgi:hypothetical protein